MLSAMSKALFGKISISIHYCPDFIRTVVFFYNGTNNSCWTRTLTS